MNASPCFLAQRLYLLLLLAALAPGAFAQGTVNSRFDVATDAVRQTLAVTVQLQSTPGTDDVGTSTIRFSYNRDALTYQSSTLENFSGRTASIGGGEASYASTVSEPAPGDMSINIVYRSSTDAVDLGQRLPGEWIDVATLEFAIVDPTADAGLAWEPLQVYDVTGQPYRNGVLEPYDAVLPVELMHFDAVVDDGAAVLTWTTATETNNAGFHVEARTQAGYETVGFVAGAGTTTEARAYRYEVDGLEPGTHVFRLKQVDFDGLFSFSPEIEVVVEPDPAFTLAPPYPNPFSTRSTVRFAAHRAEPVRVELYDIMGRLCSVLYEGVPEPGALQTVTVDGSALASGAYLVRLTGAGLNAVRPLTLVR